MDHPIEPTATTNDFYDLLNDNPGRMLLRLGFGLLLIAFCVSAFWWDDDAWFLLLCFILGLHCRAIFEIHTWPIAAGQLFA